MSFKPFRGVVRFQAHYHRFLWVQLSIQALGEEKTEEGLLKRLGQLPQELHDLYEIIFDNIMARPEDETAFARRALNWLLYNQSPLLARAFLKAVATDESGCHGRFDDDILLGLCRNLVEWDEKVNKFRFAHASVQEFLMERDGFKAPQGHFLLAQICWGVFKSGLEEDLSYYRLWEGELVHYAVKYFPVHCQLASSYNKINKRILDSFFSIDSNPVFGQWIQALAKIKGDGNLEQRLESPQPHNWTGRHELASWEQKRERERERELEGGILESPADNVHTPFSDAISSPPNPLFTISIWGLAKSLGHRSYLDANSINSTNSNGKTLLCIACEYDRIDIAREMIGSMKFLGCSIDSPNPRGYTALHSACQYGSKNVVQLLLDEGFDVNAYTHERFPKPDSTDPWPPVITLFSSGNLDPTSFLIQDRLTPLHLASRNGHLEVVKLLLAKSAPINAMSMVDQSSMCFGSLVTNSGAVYLKYEGGLAALHWAAGEGHEKVVQALLLAGADWNNRPDSEAGTLKIGTLLVNNGFIRVNVTGGRNPLSWAVWRGQLETAKLLEKPTRALLDMSTRAPDIKPDSRGSWITLKIDNLLVNSGSIHLESQASVDIGDFLVNDGTSNLNLEEATIGKLVNNTGSIHLEFHKGVIHDISNNVKGSIQIDRGGGLTSRLEKRRDEWWNLTHFAFLINRNRRYPQLEYGVTWNDGTLKSKFPPP